MKSFKEHLEESKSIDESKNKGQLLVVATKTKQQLESFSKNLMDYNDNGKDGDIPNFSKVMKAMKSFEKEVESVYTWARKK